VFGKTNKIEPSSFHLDKNETKVFLFLIAQRKIVFPKGKTPPPTLVTLDPNSPFAPESYF
jgi:hypothetical protein